METFAPGQRWYSDNEPELGLGIVHAVETRQVHLHFPAIDDDRIYRIEGAPLTRVRYLPHDTVFDKAGNKLHISAVEEHDGVLIYLGQDDQGKPRQLVETELDARLHLSHPQDRLLGGHLDPPRLYQLRQITRALQNELLPDPARGLCGCRVDLIPHQIYIAHEVAGRPAPRVLLADEVGLGKTIEAGLIMHKQLLDERISRALVLVPESLLHQWLVEMLRRFNLRFSLLDEARCEALARDGDNPFDSEQLVLCSLEMFMHNAERQQQAQEASWDLLVVDEAHHLEWSPETTSPQYQFVEQLAMGTPGVLLLTATPEQLGAAGHFARLRLLDPDRFFDLEEFLEEEELYQPVIHAVNALLENRPLSDASRQALQLALGRHPTFADLMARLENDNVNEAECKRARQQLIHLLVDRHGTGRVLFRNTRAAISGFPGRQLHLARLPLPDAYARIYAGLDNSRTAEAPIPEGLWQQETGEADNWLEFDPRVIWIIDTLRQHRGEKFLLICARADTARALEKHLRERVGIRSSVFHEGMSIIERDRAAAYFADPEQGAQVLICSEIGSEGRNFQFARYLLMFDLPSHPDLLEQRIGRLDRIGQSHDVQIHVSCFADSPQEGLYRLYHEALNAFEQPCATGASLFERFKPEIRQQLSCFPPDAHQLGRLVDEMASTHRDLSRQLEQGRDRLLELNSYRVEEADYLRRAIDRLEADPRLLDYLKQACNQFGVDLETHGPDSYVIRPGNHMLVEHFPHLPPDGLTLTFSRATALAREDWQFMSWEHPMVRGIMELVLEERHGNAALGIVRQSTYPAGTLLLECQYILEGTAPRQLQLPRFLPPTTLRRVIDPQGRDCTEDFPAGELDLVPNDLDKATRNRILRARQGQLRQMLALAETQIQEPAREIIDHAIGHMHNLMDTEIARLQHLSEINPNVRDSEIAQLRAQREALDRHIGQTTPVLDALRLLITG